MKSRKAWWKRHTRREQKRADFQGAIYQESRQRHEIPPGVDDFRIEENRQRLNKHLIAHGLKPRPKTPEPEWPPGPISDVKRYLFRDKKGRYTYQDVGTARTRPLPTQDRWLPESATGQMSAEEVKEAYARAKHALWDENLGGPGVLPGFDTYPKKGDKIDWIKLFLPEDASDTAETTKLIQQLKAPRNVKGRSGQPFRPGQPSRLGQTSQYGRPPLEGASRAGPPSSGPSSSQAPRSQTSSRRPAPPPRTEYSSSSEDSFESSSDDESSSGESSSDESSSSESEGQRRSQARRSQARRSQAGRSQQSSRPSQRPVQGPAQRQAQAESSSEEETSEEESDSEDEQSAQSSRRPAQQQRQPQAQRQAPVQQGRPSTAGTAPSSRSGRPGQAGPSQGSYRR